MATPHRPVQREGRGQYLTRIYCRRITRRRLLSLPLQLVALRSVEAVETSYEDLEYRDGRLCWSHGSAAAAVGRAGIRADKREGDGATPAGTYPLVSLFYRQDRIATPKSGLPTIRLAQNDGWVDDPGDPNYNRLVSLPYPASAERMWLDSDLYDALVVIGYNMDPVVPGAGSAMFLHIATPDFAPTAGCVAVQKEVLLGLLPLLGLGSKITLIG